MTHTSDHPCGAQHPTFKALHCDLPAGHDGDHTTASKDDGRPHGLQARLVYRGKR